MRSVAACSARCISCAKSSDGLWSQHLRAPRSLGCGRLTAPTRLARGLRTRGTASAARSTAHSRRRRRLAIRSRRHRSVRMVCCGLPLLSRTTPLWPLCHARALHRGARCLGLDRVEQHHAASARVLLYGCDGCCCPPAPPVRRVHDYVARYHSTRSTHYRLEQWSTELCAASNREPWRVCVRWAEWSTESTVGRCCASLAL